MHPPLGRQAEQAAPVQSSQQIVMSWFFQRGALNLLQPFRRSRYDIHSSFGLECSHVLLEQLLKGPRHTVWSVKVGATVAFIIGGTPYLVVELYPLSPLAEAGLSAYSDHRTSVSRAVTRWRSRWDCWLLQLGAFRAAVLGAGFAASTMIGFFISIGHGLFGFEDSWSAPFAHQGVHC